MVRIIEKKIQQKYFVAILEGKKTFELRLGDFDIEEGDSLVLLEQNENGELTGRKIEKEVTYVLNTKDIKFWSKEDVEKFGYNIISF